MSWIHERNTMWCSKSAQRLWVLILTYHQQALFWPLAFTLPTRALHLDVPNLRQKLRSIKGAFIDVYSLYKGPAHCVWPLTTFSYAKVFTPSTSFNQVLLLQPGSLMKRHLPFTSPSLTKDIDFIVQCVYATASLFLLCRSQSPFCTFILCCFWSFRMWKCFVFIVYPFFWWRDAGGQWGT